jgi:hypothetical protein
VRQVVAGTTFRASFQQRFGLCKAKTACCAGDKNDFVREAELGEAVCRRHFGDHVYYQEEMKAGEEQLKLAQYKDAW